MTASAASPDANSQPAPSEPAAVHFLQRKRVQAAGLGLAYFLTALAGIELAALPGGVGEIWIGNALVLAVLLKSPRRDWPLFLAAMLIGGSAAYLAMGFGPPATLVPMAANAVEIMIAAFAITALALPIDQFDSDFTVYVRVQFSAGIAAPAITAPVLAAGLWWMKAAPVEINLLSWWLGHGLSTIVILPIALTLNPKSLRQTFGGRKGLLTIAVTALAFGGSSIAFSHLRYPAPLIGVPLLASALLSTPLGTALTAAASLVALIVQKRTGQIPNLDALTAAIALTMAAMTMMPFSVSLLIRRLRLDRARIGESEQRFRSAMEHSAIGMALVALDGRWTKVNRSLCELLGYSEAEMATRFFHDVVHGDERPIAAEWAKLLVAREVNHIWLEMRLRRKDGGLVWALLAASLVRDLDSDEPLYYIAQIEDISQRHALSEALWQEKERLLITLQSIGDAVFSTDADGHISFMNAAAETLTGWSAREGMDQDIASVLRLVDEESGQAVPCQSAKSLLTKASQTRKQDVTLIRRGGEKRAVRETATPVIDKSGEVVGTVLVCQDITQTRRLERALKALGDPLLTGQV